MANTKSAEKQARVSVRRRVINNRLVSAARTLEKKIKTLASQGKAKEATELLPRLQSSLDKVAKKRAFHPNKSARIKSRVTKLTTKAAASK